MYLEKIPDFTYGRKDEKVKKSKLLLLKKKKKINYSFNNFLISFICLVFLYSSQRESMENFHLQKKTFLFDQVWPVLIASRFLNL